MKKRRLFLRQAALLALCAAALAGVWAEAETDALSEKVVRLHVVARSDSAADQAVKLLVRDAVLGKAEALLARASSPEEAQAILRQNLPVLARTAAAVSGGPARAKLGEEYFPTRISGIVALPAGRYTALRIVLGEGEGHNWWGVVYPPLCPAAGEEAAEAASLTEDDLKLITADGEEYVFKFRVLEWWGELKHMFSREE